MGNQPQPRLAVAAILLTLQVLLLVSQYLASIKDPHRRKFLPGSAFLQTLILLFPILVAVLGIILTAIMFNGKASEEACKCNKIDEDIGGPGIRFAAWAQLGVLLFLVLIGIFHTKTTGIKEIAASLTINHLSLVIALLVKLKDLEGADAILGSMILDSQNSALSIPLVTKATLAARWQVWTIIPCQVFGLAVIGVLVRKFHHSPFNACCKGQCVSVIWWGRLGAKNCSLGWEQRLFWLYYTSRILSVAQIGSQALVDTWAFHEAENNNNEVDSKTFHPLSDSDPSLMNFLRKFLRVLRVSGRWKFKDYPTTLSLTFLVSGVFAVASTAAAEAAMANDSFSMQSHDFKIGQIIPIVVASAGMIVGVWRFICLFLNADQIGRHSGGKWKKWLFKSS